MWSGWTVGNLIQKVRPHIWYFVISNCHQDLGDANLVLDYELHLKQVDGSEFSIEMRSMMTWNCFALVCLAFCACRYWSRCCSFIDSVGELHQVIWVLVAAVTFQFLAQTLHCLHLWRYRDDGVGLVSVDVVAEVFFMLSQVVQTTLLIAIAMGYTILPSRRHQMTIVKWIALLSLSIHVVLVSFAKLQDESASKYHENEGPVGWVLLTVRVMLFIWFLFATSATQQEGGPRLEEFISNFRVAGSIYFVAYPLIFIVVQIFAPYLQHPIMQVGLLVMQTASAVWLAELFLSRGAYFKVSALSSSLLPGCSGAFDKLS